jgi:hypothetical protein
MLFCKFLIIFKLKTLFIFSVFLFNQANAVINGLEPVSPGSRRAKITNILVPKQDFLVCIISHYLAEDGHFYAHFIVKEADAYVVFRRKLKITDENGIELKKWHEKPYIQSPSIKLTQPMVAKILSSIENSHKRISFEDAEINEQSITKYDVMYQTNNGRYLGFVAECDSEADLFVNFILLSTFYKNDELDHHFKNWLK